jgi:hypothetical protein
MVMLRSKWVIFSFLLLSASASAPASGVESSCPDLKGLYQIERVIEASGCVLHSEYEVKQSGCTDISIWHTEGAQQLEGKEGDPQAVNAYFFSIAPEGERKYDEHKEKSTPQWFDPIVRHYLMPPHWEPGAAGEANVLVTGSYSRPQWIFVGPAQNIDTFELNGSDANRIGEIEIRAIRTSTCKAHLILKKKTK